MGQMQAGQASIVVADDGKLIRAVISRHLRDAGYEVLEASDGVEALQRIEAGGVDMMVLDVIMPELDGLQTLTRVREVWNPTQLPVIMATANEEIDDIVEAFQLGANDYVTKPINYPVLLARIATQLQIKRAAEELKREIDLRTHAEAELQEAHDSLEVKVQERTAQLRANNVELIRQHREIRSFYHTVSHELKTPLTSAREFLNIVLDGLAGDLSDKQREFLRRANDSCGVIKDHVSDLLDATALEDGGVSLTPKRLAAADVAAKAVAVATGAAEKKGLAVETVVADAVPELMADESRVLQVLRHLLQNAVRFTESGTVSLRVEADSGAGMVAFIVADTGCGIAPEDQSKIFDRLYQVGTRQDALSTSGSLGLGLFIARGLVEQMGGEIQVESAIGKGSTFRFTLPAAG